MVQTNQALLEKFYRALQTKNLAQLAECYHQEAKFTDEVFENLKGQEVLAMWAMLFERSSDLSITYDKIEAGAETGTGHWEATYTFSRTNRKVLNRINSSFEFKDGRIYRQRDSFSLWRWARSALGTTGTVAGWSQAVRKAIRREANEMLQQHMEKNKNQA